MTGTHSNTDNGNIRTAIVEEHHKSAHTALDLMSSLLVLENSPFFTDAKLKERSLIHVRCPLPLKMKNIQTHTVKEDLTHIHSHITVCGLLIVVHHL